MNSSCGYNCSFSSRERELAPYADVAGPGVSRNAIHWGGTHALISEKVIAGFLGTAWLCVILVLIHYFLVFDPHQDPFHECVAGRPAGGDEARGWIANPIDVMFKNFIERAEASVSANGRPGVVNWIKKDPKWQTAFVKVTPMPSDYELVN